MLGIWLRDEGKHRAACEDHLIAADAPVMFLEIYILDASDFSADLFVRGLEVGPYRVLRAQSAAVPNAIAAFLLHLRDHTDKIPHAYFNWSEGNPVLYLIRYLLSGQGDVAPLTREILRQAEPKPEDAVRRFMPVSVYRADHSFCNAVDSLVRGPFMEALEPTAGWWRVLWIRVISKRRNHKNSPFAEHSVQPVYQETYDVDKLAAELAADRSKFKELWLPRVRMCCELPPQRSVFGLVDRVPCRGNGVATDFNIRRPMRLVHWSIFAIRFPRRANQPAQMLIAPFRALYGRRSSMRLLWRWIQSGIWPPVAP